MTTAKLDQIGEQKAQKEAHQGGGDTFDDQRNARGLGPVGATDARDLAKQPSGLGALEVVAGARKDQLPRERSMVDPCRDAGWRIISRERLASASLKLIGKAVASAERPVPQCRRDAGGENAGDDRPPTASAPSRQRGSDFVLGRFCADARRAKREDA